MLQRKKKWKDEQIGQAISRMHSISNLTILVPTDADIVTGYNLQNLSPLGPFDAIYLGMKRTTPTDYLITRDKNLQNMGSKAEEPEVVLTPEEFLQRVKL